MIKHPIPPTITQVLGQEQPVIDDLGMSSADILLFDDKVLKISAATAESKNERTIIEWLQGRLPVPQILATDLGETDYLLMSRVKGQLACSDTYLNEPETLVRLLAQGLKMLWAVDISHCPVPNTLPSKLAEAEFNVQNGLCNVEDAEEGTYGEQGFADPAALLQWLKDHQPDPQAEQLAFSHGDYCLPNLFFDGDEVSGFIDLGRGGIADIYQDIALCYRSLVHNFSGKYDGIKRPDFNIESFWAALEIEPDWNKINYYILLDELF